MKCPAKNCYQAEGHQGKHLPFEKVFNKRPSPKAQANDLCINCNRDMARYCHACMQVWLSRHDRLISALDVLVNAVDPKIRNGVLLEDYFVEPVEQARALLREAKGTK